jgi:TPR repeat protein
MLYDGKGVAQSFEEAVRWYRLAAAEGHADALYNLGACYANGPGVPRDIDEALRLYKRAAAEGHAGAVEEVEHLRGFLAAHGR